MLIYNTLTQKKEKFIPQRPNTVTMYVCGPTVYDYFHIGNARSFVMADVVRKYLEYKGFVVKFVMNITDVDDKIINRAKKENTTTDSVADKFTRAFLEDITALKIEGASIYPKATEHMTEMVNLIEQLEKKGFAYNVEGDVYYNVKNFNGYGKLSHKNIDDLISGSRVEIDERKANPLDFSLWKKAKEEEPSWNSPWGKGRPGWHTECSAMSLKHLGETIDIHAGGHDLIFPHHENEIAQSEAVTSKPFVKYWIHFGFLNFKEEKMSKSLGNFFTARDVLKTHSAESVRLFFNQAHYRAPLNFSSELLTSAESALEKLDNFMDILREKENTAESKDTSRYNFNFEEYYSRFETAMDDDFNTPQATAAVFDFVRAANKFIAENISVSKEFYNEAEKFMLKTAEKVLGILKSEKQSSAKSLEKDLIKILIDIRQKAREKKDFELSDEIRNKLNEIGIELKDSKEGTSFKLK